MMELLGCNNDLLKRNLEKLENHPGEAYAF
jgi:hypothetical protein